MDGGMDEEEDAEAGAEAVPTGPQESLETAMLAAAVDVQCLPRVVERLRASFTTLGVEVNGMLRSSTVFALGCIGVQKITCRSYFDLVVADPTDAFARRFVMLMCLQLHTHDLHRRLVARARGDRRRALCKSKPYWTAPLWLPTASQQIHSVCMETLPKPPDRYAVLDNSGRPLHSKTIPEKALSTLLSSEEFELGKNRSEREFSALTEQDVARIKTTPFSSMILGDLEQLAYGGEEERVELGDVEDHERAVAMGAVTVLLANATNVSGMSSALGAVPATRRTGDSERLCNYHASWWPMSHGPMPRMRIRTEDAPGMAWMDAFPVVFQDYNTATLSKLAPGLMEEATNLYAPVHRTYFEHVCNSEVTVRCDTSDELQIGANLYSAGCVHRLRTPAWYEASKELGITHHPMCEAESKVVLDYGKTESAHLRKAAEHRSDTANRTRALIVMAKGFVHTVCSVSVVRNGAGTFATASSGVCGSEAAYTAREYLEKEGKRVLKLSSEDFQEQTRCAYEDFATESKLMACDFVSLGVTIHRYFTPLIAGVIAGAPTARHCMPLDMLPTKRPLSWCWPPEVFTPVVDELQRRRCVRRAGESSSGRRGSVRGALIRGAEESQTEVAKYKQEPPPPWTREAIPLPSTKAAMERRIQFWANRQLSKETYEGLRNHVIWSRKQHRLLPDKWKACIVSILWVCKAYGLDGDCIDAIVIYMLPEEHRVRA
tara:strand:- start:163 stop:2316 length:2154 start_codon:yes stop_codon:yes gene_type:complete